MTKKRVIRVVLWVGVALSLGTWAIGQTAVQLTAPSPGPSYDGIYVSPYYALVNGVNTAIVCDDFGDDTTIGDKWNATVTSFPTSTQTSTSWGAGATLAQYNEVGWLTLQVLQQAPNSLGQINYTFALWAVFDPIGVENWLKSNNPGSGAPETVTQLCNTIFGSAYGCNWSVGDTLGGYLLQASNASVPIGGYGLEVLSPDTPGTTNVCKAENGCPAQEFIAVVPEGGAALAYLLLAGFCCFGAIRMRTRRQVARITVA